MSESQFSNWSFQGEEKINRNHQKNGIMRKKKPMPLNPSQSVDQLQLSMQMKRQTCETSQTAFYDYDVIDGQLNFHDEPIHQDDDHVKVEQVNRSSEKEALGIPQKMEDEVKSSNKESTNSQKEISEPQDRQEESNTRKTKNIQKSVKINKMSLPRIGRTQQSKAQKLLRDNTNSHYLNNLESKIRTVIKNGFRRENIKYPLKRTLNRADLNDLVKSSGLNKAKWEKILNLKQIDSYISNPCNKLGTSRHFKDKPKNERKKIINLSRDILKIVMRSARRKILRCCDGQEIVQYMDEDANNELRGLDKISEQLKKLLNTQGSSFTIQSGDQVRK